MIFSRTAQLLQLLNINVQPECLKHDTRLKSDTQYKMK